MQMIYGILIKKTRKFVFPSNISKTDVSYLLFNLITVKVIIPRMMIP